MLLVRCSVALHEPLRKELNTMVEQGIITQVTDPMPWVSIYGGGLCFFSLRKMVVYAYAWTQKIWIRPSCASTTHPLPTIEDIATRLSGAKVFSILDVKHGFGHIKLHLQSSLATTFNTPFGRYRWCRMPFGISSALEAFQRRMQLLIEGLHGIEVVADDFMMWTLWFWNDAWKSCHGSWC